MTLQQSDETTQLGRPSRRRNPEDTRRRILDAGERAFALRGYAGARLRDIAQEAGVHHALVHHYYGDKLGLFGEVLERGLGRIEPGVETLGDGRGREANVRAFVAVLYDFCANNKSLLRIIENAFRDREAASFELAERVIGKRARPLIGLVRERIELGQKHGDVRSDVPSNTLVRLTFSAIAYRFTMAEPFAEALSVGRAGDGEGSDEEREHVIRYVLSTLRPQR
jgi:TetR/AcrR family transcriptional regulator